MIVIYSYEYPLPLLLIARWDRALAHAGCVIARWPDLVIEKDVLGSRGCDENEHPPYICGIVEPLST